MAGRVNDPTASAAGSDLDALIFNVVWNFYEATSISVLNDLNGMLIAPSANLDIVGNVNGRVYIGGDLTHSGAGTEIHNYPFTGELSSFCVPSTPSSIVCGPINTLYQTIGNNGVAEVYRYKSFQQSYVKVGELEGAIEVSASNSAYNAVTQLVYSSERGTEGKVFRVYDPVDSYKYLGDITFTGSTENASYTLFAYENYIGFVDNNKVVLIDVTGLTYPATVAAVEKTISPTPTGTKPNDYSLIGDEIYGVIGSTLRIINISGANATLVEKTISFDNSLDGVAPDQYFGASWQDRNGNFYFFNNGNGAIYKITDILNAPASNVPAVKILLANPSSRNDGFGCEIGYDPLDWDNDTVENSVDIDDDNDGILDINESPLYPGIDPAGDEDGDGVFNYRDQDDAAIIGVTAFIDVNGDDINDNFDFDLDGIPDSYDLDSDNDGIPDNVEAQTTLGYISPSDIATFTDADGDGLDDNYDANTSSISGSLGLTPVDTDASGYADYLDVDADNDGIYDSDEAGFTLTGLDSDFDGLDDATDAADGVLVPNGTITNPSTLPDADADVNLGGGDVDYRDSSDSDNDGILDIVDLDDDNDGILDTAEYLTYDPFGDEDGDGILNFADVFDNDIVSDGSTTDYTDLNNDGVPDVYDEDLDGIQNHLDTYADGDGCPDAIEGDGNLTQSHLDVTGAIIGSVDSNGVPDVVSGGQGVGDAINALVSTACGVPDIDADNDGLIDTLEGKCSIDQSLVWATEFPDTATTRLYTFDDLEVNASDSVLIDFTIEQNGDSNTTLSDSGLVNTRTGAEATEGIEYLVDWNSGALYSTDPNQNATFIYTFSKGVRLNEFIIKDIDRESTFTDGVKVQAVDEYGNTFSLNATRGSSISEWPDPHNPGDVFYYYNGDTNAPRSDQNHWVTFDSNGLKITELIITASAMDGTVVTGTVPTSPSRFIFSTLDLCTDTDFDNDGIPDFLDTDSDNDSCPDALEGNAGYTLTDVDAYGALTAAEDVNGVPGGVQQTDVSGLDWSTTSGECDDDQDGVINSADKCEGSNDTIDHDNDGIPDFCDLDDDNDGILDAVEGACHTNADLIWNATDTYGNANGTANPSFTLTGLNGSSVGVTLTAEYTGTNAPTEDISAGGLTYRADGSVLQLLPAWTSIAINGTDPLATYTLDFTESVILNNINIKDIDRQPTFVDAIKVVAEDASGNSVVLSVSDGSALTTDANGFYYFNGDGNSSFTDANHWLTVHSNGLEIKKLIIIASPSTGTSTGIVPTSASRFGLGALDLCIPLDTDNDSVPDYLDLDADNDGIYDAVEAGHDAAQTDGVLTGGVNPSNGIPSSVDNGSGGVNYTVLNTDSTHPTNSDIIPNYLDTDSDGDGCNDANEAYGSSTADGGDGSQYGTGDPLTLAGGGVNADGAVVSAAYSTPVNLDSSKGDTTLDYL